jgi:hypothetical protein
MQVHRLSGDIWSAAYLKYPSELELEDTFWWQLAGADLNSVTLWRPNNGKDLTIKDKDGNVLGRGTHQFWIKPDPNDPSGGFVRLHLCSNHWPRNHWFQLSHEWHPRWHPIDTASKFIGKEEGFSMTLLSKSVCGCVP